VNRQRNLNCVRKEGREKGLEQMVRALLSKKKRPGAQRHILKEVREREDSQRGNSSLKTSFQGGEGDKKVLRKKG